MDAAFLDYIYQHVYSLPSSNLTSLSNSPPTNQTLNGTTTHRDIFKDGLYSVDTVRRMVLPQGRCWPTRKYTQLPPGWTPGPMPHSYHLLSYTSTWAPYMAVAVVLYLLFRTLTWLVGLTARCVQVHDQEGPGLRLLSALMPSLATWTLQPRSTSDTGIRPPSAGSTYFPWTSPDARASIYTTAFTGRSGRQNRRPHSTTDGCPHPSHYDILPAPVPIKLGSLANVTFTSPVTTRHLGPPLVLPGPVVTSSLTPSISSSLQGLPPPPSAEDLAATGP
jgi:hypothetical protein